MAAPRRVQVVGRATREGGAGPTHGLPPGGGTGEVLTKVSNADYDVSWLASAAGEGSGATFNAFGIVATPNDASILATAAGDTLTFTSPDGTVVAATNAGTRTLGLIVNRGTVAGTVMDGGDTRVTNSLLTAFRALATPVADRLAYFTGAASMALTTFTAFARSFLAAVDDAAGRQVLNLRLFEWSWHVETLAVKTYTMCESTPFSGSIVSVARRCGSGSGTFSVQINGANVGGLSGLAIGTTQATSNASSPQTFVAGSRITLVVTANSACLDFAPTLAYQR